MLVVWQTVALALVAGWLLHRGLRGTRVGDEPRCRKCDYRLDGLTSQQCPECGTAISNKSVVHGTRVVRRRYVVAAILTPLLWMPIQTLLWALPGINWISSAPTIWCIRLSEADNVRAIEELKFRTNRDGLDGDSIDRICVIANAKLTAKPGDSNWLDLVDALAARKSLTPKQRSSFFPNARRPLFKHRGEIRQGDPLIVYYESDPKNSSRYSIWRSDETWRNGQRLVEAYDYLSVYARGNAAYTSSGQGLLWLNTSGWKPGLTSIDVGLRTGGPGIGRSFMGESVAHQFSVTVLPAEHSPLVSCIQEPIDGEAIRSKLGVMLDNIMHESDFVSLFRIFIDVREAIDIPLAWAVSVEIDGTLYEDLGVVGNPTNNPTKPFPAWDVGETGTWLSHQRLTVHDGHQAHVILRGRRRTALLHPEMKEVWCGELRFGPFPWVPDSLRKQLRE